MPVIPKLAIEDHLHPVPSTFLYITSSSFVNYVIILILAALKLPATDTLSSQRLKSLYSSIIHTDCPNHPFL
jgi:hypothetical protein